MILVTYSRGNHSCKIEQMLPTGNVKLSDLENVKEPRCNGDSSYWYIDERDPRTGATTTVCKVMAYLPTNLTTIIYTE